MHALMVTFQGKLLSDLVYIPVMNTRLYTPFRMCKLNQYLL